MAFCYPGLLYEEIGRGRPSHVPSGKHPPHLQCEAQASAWLMRSTCLSLLGHEVPLQVTLAALLFFGPLLWCLAFRNMLFLKISFVYQWQGDRCLRCSWFQRQWLTHLCDSVSHSLIASLVVAGPQHSAEIHMLSGSLSPIQACESEDNLKNLIFFPDAYFMLL